MESLLLVRVVHFHAYSRDCEIEVDQELDNVPVSCGFLLVLRYREILIE